MKMDVNTITFNSDHINHEFAVNKSQFKTVALSTDYAVFLDKTCAQLSQKILCARSVEDQVIAMKQVSKTLLNKDFEVDVTSATYINCLKLTTDLFLAAPLKHPLKKSISKLINSLTGDHTMPVKGMLCEGLKSHIDAGLASKCFLDLNTAVQALFSTLENLIVGPAVMESMKCDVFAFLENTLVMCSATMRVVSSPMIKQEVSKLTHFSLRIVVIVLQKLPKISISCRMEEFNMEQPHAILKCVNQLMNNTDIPLDTRSLCGLVIILILDSVEGSKGWMQLLDANSIKPSEFVDVLDQISSISICSGILSGLRAEQLQSQLCVLKKSVLSCIFDTALELNAPGMQDSCTILGVWRLFQQLTRALTMHPALVSCLTALQFQHLVNHLWSQLDHYIDTVKHLARAVLEYLVQLKSACISLGFDICKKMTEAVLQLPKTRRGPYVILDVMANHIGAAEVINILPNLVPMLLNSMQCPTASSYASSAFSSIVATHMKEVPQSCWIETWVMPLLALMQNNEVYEVAALEDALSKVLKLCPVVIDEVLASIKWTDNHCHLNLKTLLTCLKIARKLGLLNLRSEPGCDKLWHGIVPQSVLHSVLVRQSDELRLAGLALVVETNKSTEMINLEDFDLIQYFLENNVNYDLPAIRQQTLGLLFKFLTRMNESANCLQRSISQRNEETNMAFVQLDMYRKFLSWLTSFCFKNLAVGSNFNRRICSLKLLTCILDLFKLERILTNNDWKSLVFIEKNGLNLLSVILVDTFEENKAIAATILISFPPCVFGLKSASNLTSIIQSGLKMSASAHPSDCVSAAYVLELCINVSSTKECLTLENIPSCTKEESIFRMIQSLKLELEGQLQCAQRSLLEAASNGPMYGSLFCIRHLLRLIPDLRKLELKLLWQALLCKLVDLCLEISHTVSPIVNSSSPEGHLPMDFNNGNFYQKTETSVQSTPFKATAQMVLLCSWRSVREVSLFLGELSERCPILPDKDGILAEEQLLAVGDHLIKLLEETKHRGAFEQAYVGFSLLAVRLWKHPKKSLHVLPQHWLDELLIAIESVKPIKSKLCATRRSAGVPFLVQALVTAELQTNAGPSSLQKTMKQLLNFAADKEKHVECRTHALNILRALFRHTLLAEHVLPFITEGFMVAISGFEGASWAERNSATLLFSSLMTRVFGVRRSRETINLRNKMTGYVFFHRYPELYGYLLANLEQAVVTLQSHNTAELATLYPILLLLARLYPSPFEGTNSSIQLCVFVPWVQKCAGSTVLKTRIAAAKAVVPLITANTFTPHVDALVNAIVAERQENMIHGLLLQAAELLRSATLVDEHLEVFCNELKTWISKLFQRFSKNCCLTAREVFLQICEIVAEYWYSSITLSDWHNIQEYLHMALKQNEHTPSFTILTIIGLNVFEARAARVLLQQSVLRKDAIICQTVYELLNHKSYEVVHETLIFLEQILGRLNLFQMDEEEESVLLDATESQEFWVSRLPSENVSALCKILQNNEKLGEKLTLMLKCNFDLKSRLALRALAQMACHAWYQYIDISLLVSYCSSSHEASSCAAMSCFSALLSVLVNGTEGNLSGLDAGCKLIPRFCSEERSLSCRAVALNFLLHHKGALKLKYSFLKDETVCELWMSAIKLTSDEDLNIRKTIASLVSNVPHVSNLTQELLLKEFVEVMEHSPMCLATLLALGLGSAPDINSLQDVEERVFDKGEMNLFHEPEILTDMVCKHLSNLSGKNNLSSFHFNWIYSTVCGTESNEITSESNLFECLHALINDGFHFTHSDYLIPAPLASFMHRVSLIESTLFGASKFHPHECLPFQFSKLIGA